MTTTRVAVEFPLAAGVELPLEPLTEALHRWIREDLVLKDDTPIDVVDYSHVPAGPGVMLVTHEGQYRVRTDEGRVWVGWFGRRGPVPDSLEAATRKAIRRAAKAVQLLGADDTLGRPAADLQNWTLKVEDRLLASNDDTSFEALRPELQQTLHAAVGGDVELARTGDPRAPLTVSVTVSGDAPSAGRLAEA